MSVPKQHYIFQGHKAGTDQYRAVCICGWQRDGNAKQVSGAIREHYTEPCVHLEER